MQRFGFFLMLFAIIACVPACKKDSGPTESSNSALTEQEKQAIIQTYQTIAATADTILLGNNPIAGFQALLASYRSASNVEDARVTDDALYVKFKKFGTLSWYVAPGVTIPPYGRPVTMTSQKRNQIARSLSKSAALTVCLINQLSTDEGRTSYTDYFSTLKTDFEQAGFTVTTINGPQANINFFKTRLKEFGVIFLIAHGDYDAQNDLTWICTGQELTGNEAERMNQLLPYLDDVTAGKISAGGFQETRNGQRRTTDVFKVSNRFFEANYATGDFQNSVIYLSTCQGMRDADIDMAKTFQRKGAGIVIGWTQKHEIGPHTGKLLFSFLLCGSNVTEVMQSLPRESKSAVYQGVRADLTYYPTTAGNTRLVPGRRTPFNLTRPLKDSTYTMRNLILQGNIIDGERIIGGLLELNGIATDLVIQANGFSQPILLKSGRNTVHISSCTRLRNGTLAASDTSFDCTGNFGLLDLFTELRWNTDRSDVDFHLLPPGATFPGSFWTTADCYYGNRTPSWGGFLDVDDVDGRGPEHITIPTVSSMGTYRLFVHYYDAHGAGTTDAFVTISVRNGPDQQVGPLRMSLSASRGGDVWEVCTIDYPTGTITPVEVLRRLPGEATASLFRERKK